MNLRERLSRRPGWRRQRRWAVLAVVVALLLDVTGRSVLSWREVSGAYADLQTAEAALRPIAELDGSAWPGRAAYEAALPAAQRAARDLGDARDRLWFRGAAVSGLSWVPWLGDDVHDGVALLEGGATLAEGGAVLLATAAPLFEPDRPLIPAAREILVGRQDEIRHALALLDEARTRLAPVEPGRGLLVGRYSERLEEYLPLLDRVTEARSTYESAVEQFDAVFGYDGPVTYVLAGQNDQELRPTGGFIGSMGVLTLEDGQITSSRYASSTEFDPPTQPERGVPAELSRYLGIGYWNVRDANWWPDFPTSAGSILTLLEEDAGITADGVIAVDSQFVGALIGVFEPVSVSGFTEPLTAENWFRLAEASITGESGNTSAEDGITTHWRTSGSNVLEAVDLRDAGISTDGLPEGVHTAIRATTGDVDQLVVYSFQLQPGEEYRGSFYVWVPPDWTAGPPFVDFAEFDGMVGGDDTLADPSLYGTWQRLETVGTPGADASGNLRVYLTAPTPPGSTLYVTYAAAVPSDPELQQATAAGAQSAKQAYLEPVLDTLTGHLQAAGSERIGPLVRAVQTSSAGRHFQFFHRDADAQRLIEQLGSSGTLRPEAGVETIAVVDSNLSYSKIQTAIKRDVFALVGLYGIRDVVISWHNFLPDLGEARSGRLGKGGAIFDAQTRGFQAVDGVFGTYVRVYAPAGSQLVRFRGLDGEPHVTEENGFTVFGGWVIVRSGERRQVSLSYLVRDQQPTLRLWKQGGIESYGLRVLKNSETEQTVLYEGEATADVRMSLE